jgi:hypothetical protein
MNSGSKFGTVPATWHVVSTAPQERQAADEKAVAVSYVDTQGLDSVWHATECGAWSITEALAAICVGVFAGLHSPKASVQFVVPSTAQAMLTSRLLDDFDLSDMSVSTTATQLHENWRSTIFVVSLPQYEDGSHYAEMMQQVQGDDVRSDADEVISVGEVLGRENYDDIPLNALSRHALRAPCVGRFRDRGDLIERLVRLSPSASQQVLPLRSSRDIDNIAVLMGHGDWSDDKVICLCDTDLPPIVASLAPSLSDEADVLTNSPKLIGPEAATSKVLRTMHDFDDEAIVCTLRQWLLVEPQLGRGGSHRSATLFMRGASTTSFILDVALGAREGEMSVIIPEQAETLDEDDEDSSEQQDTELVESVDVASATSWSSDTTGHGAKKTRCRCYSDLHAKRLREVLERMTPEEVSTLLACLESPPPQ